MKWTPIAGYKRDMGCVLVWVEWPSYNAPTGGMSGDWYLAYTINAAGADVWVTAHDSIPLETTGRRITHFVAKESP